jgi:hypothetical protein
VHRQTISRQSIHPMTCAGLDRSTGWAAAEGLDSTQATWASGRRISTDS